MHVTPPPRAVVAVWGFALLLAAGTGCEREIDTTYAAVRGPSINGVAAFVQLLRDTGHSVTARQSLPAEVDPDVATVVVFDESFTGLSPQAAERLPKFVFGGGSRTLLLVLRDSDCIVDYLRDILGRDDLSPDRRTRATALLAGVEEALATATTLPRATTPPFPDGLATMPRPPTAEAIDVRLPAGGDGPPTSITARWELRRRLRFDDDGEEEDDAVTLWQAGEDRLLVRRRLGGGTLMVLASAAPLLNGGLVDPGNRLLAENLAGLLPTDGKLLVTASAPEGDGGSGDGGSGDGGDDDADDDEDEPSPWRLLGVQPLPWIAAQAIAALALFCWCTAPIFGRPRRSSPAHAQNFGHHVDALANLLAKTPAAGAAFARERLDAWRPPATPAAPKSRRPPRP